MVHPAYNSGSAVRIILQFCTMKGAKRDIFLALVDLLLRQIASISFITAIGSLNSQDIIKMILKESGHDFSGKRLCDGYCTEIMCDVYVWRSIFDRGSYGFVKKVF